MEDALAHKGDEGRGVTAISFGEPSSGLWSGDDRMGEPNQANLDYSTILKWSGVHLAK